MQTEQQLAVQPADSVMKQMVFVTGFARGGTSWLRDCIGSHPDVAVLPTERTIFRDTGDREKLAAYFEREVPQEARRSRFVINKAPANAPFIGRAARAFPESHFIFIIRDPRDVLVSHQRGNKAWMKGRNSTVEGCMDKIQTYFEGWRDAEGLPNVHLVRYEDLHQNFFATMREIFDFIGAEADDAVLDDIYARNHFAAQTKRANKEDPDSAKRKGVIGEWAVHLKQHEVDWYERSRYFRDFMPAHGYSPVTHSYKNIVEAMREGGVHFLSEEDLLARRLDPARMNVVLQHDIDYLNKPWCFESVERTAEIEAELGAPAAYNFLPLDDSRYSEKGKDATLALMRRVCEINPAAYLGLHVNACERFYPPSAPNVDTPPDLDAILAYLHRQVEEYKEAGIEFRIATAHGYGRAKKRPNNRDTPEIEAELKKHGILLFDTTIRSDLMQAAGNTCAITDVGGILKPRRFGHGYMLTDSRAYSSLPKGGFLRFLTHPGNYPVDAPSTVAMRVF
jgi:hypothetical protein